MSKNIANSIQDLNIYKQGYNKGVEDAIRIYREGIAELVKSPYATDITCVPFKWAYNNITGMIDDVIIEKDLKKLKEKE